MIPLIIALFIFELIGIGRRWQENSALTLSIIFTIGFIAFQIYTKDFRPQKIIEERTELYSIKNFSSTSGSIWYIGTDSDYISYIKKGNGFQKFRMPERSIIIEDNTLIDKGYFIENICIPGQSLNLWTLISNVDNNRCWVEYDKNYTIKVPKNTVTLNFKI